MKPTQELLTLDDVLPFDIAQRIELRDFYRAVKLPSAEEEKALDAQVEKALRTADRLIQAMQRAGADPIEISQKIAVRADELRRRGVRDPVTQAEKEIAKQLGHASGSALNRWLRRHR